MSYDGLGRPALVTDALGRSVQSTYDADNDEPTDSEPRQDVLERRLLERVAVALLDERFGLVRAQLRDDLPLVASAREIVVVVLDPYHLDILLSRFLDETADVRDD